MRATLVAALALPDHPSISHAAVAASAAIVCNRFLHQAQFGYTCSETFTGLIAWVAYWVYPFIVMLFHMRMVCFR